MRKYMYINLSEWHKCNRNLISRAPVPCVGIVSQPYTYTVHSKKYQTVLSMLYINIQSKDTQNLCFTELTNFKCIQQENTMARTISTLYLTLSLFKTSSLIFWGVRCLQYLYTGTHCFVFRENFQSLFVLLSSKMSSNPSLCFAILETSTGSSEI